MRTFFLSLSSILALACASPKDAESPHEHGDHEHGDKHEHGDHGDKHGEHGEGEKPHAKLADGPVKDFHSVLSPVWHMDKGPARLEKACAAVPAMKEKAAAVVTAAAPGKASIAGTLQTRVSELETGCAAGPSTVEAAFSSVHDAFHAVMDSEKH